MIIDIILLLFIFTGFWTGYTQGIARTLFSIVCYTSAFLLTLKLSPWLVDLLTRTFDMGKLPALIIGTFLLLILMILLVRWLLKSVENYLKKSTLNRFSKILGGVVMILVSLIMFSFMLWAFNELGWIGEKSKQSSLAYAELEKIPVKTKTIAEEFKPLFRRYWELMQQSIQEEKSGTPG